MFGLLKKLVLNCALVENKTSCFDLLVFMFARHRTECDKYKRNQKTGQGFSRGVDVI